MADNLTTTVTVSTIPSGTVIGTDDVAGVHIQKVKLVDGTADSGALIPGDATNGLDVDVTRLPALPAGTNNIGDVDVLSLPALPAGTNAIGVVSTKTALTAAAPTAVSVGVASGALVALNANRKGLIITNTDEAAIVSLGFSGNAAVLFSGVTLYPGGSFVMDEFSFTTGAVAAIADTSTTNVAIQEFS